MKVSRRRLIQSLALAAGPGAAAKAAETTISIEVLRDVSTFQGTNFADDRLRTIKPALEHRLDDLRALRNFAFDDSVAPAQGILDK
jgi:hypothetical protein